MKSKLYFVATLALLVAVVPAMSSAQTASSTNKRAPVRQEVKNIKNQIKEVRKETREEVKDLKKDIKEVRKDNKEAVKNLVAREKVVKYVRAYVRDLQERIRVIENALARLSGVNGIIAKMEAAGKDTTLVKTKLADAKTAVTKAKTDLASAIAGTKDLASATSTASTTASSTENVNKVKQVKALFEGVAAEIKVAQSKANDVLKAIKEVRGIGAINAGTTTVATTTASSTN